MVELFWWTLLMEKTHISKACSKINIISYKYQIDTCVYAKLVNTHSIRKSWKNLETLFVQNLRQNLNFVPGIHILINIKRIFRPHIKFSCFLSSEDWKSDARVRFLFLFFIFSTRSNWDFWDRNNLTFSKYHEKYISIIDADRKIG